MLDKIFNKKRIYPKTTAIITAAGSGKRMNSDIKKQFMNLIGRPVIAHTIENISKCDFIDSIILVVAEEDIIFIKDIVLSLDDHNVKEIVVGGKKRALSVSKGLALVPDDCEIVLIHDGVRPIVSVEEIRQCVLSAEEFGCASLGVKLKDAIKKVDKSDFICETIDRDELVAIQTPQCFQYEIIKKAYTDFDENATDDCALVEKLGYKVKITDGSYKNIKLTTTEDLIMLDALIEDFYEEDDDV